MPQGLKNACTHVLIAHTPRHSPTILNAPTNARINKTRHHSSCIKHVHSRLFTIFFFFQDERMRARMCWIYCVYL